MKRIKKIGVFQTAKVAAIIYFILAAILMIPFALISTLVGTSEIIPGYVSAGGIFMFIILPFVYGFFAFIFVAIGCAIYNLVAGWTGGIEIETDEAPPTTF